MLDIWIDLTMHLYIYILILKIPFNRHSNISTEFYCGSNILPRMWIDTAFLSHLTNKLVTEYDSPHCQYYFHISSSSLLHLIRSPHSDFLPLMKNSSRILSFEMTNWKINTYVNLRDADCQFCIYLTYIFKFLQRILTAALTDHLWNKVSLLVIWSSSTA